VRHDFGFGDPDCLGLCVIFATGLKFPDCFFLLVLVSASVRFRVDLCCSEVERRGV
jgi:hypothetical protein